MSDGTLSQDEIDALLQGTDELMTESLGDSSISNFGGGRSVSADALTDNEKANLGEILREVGTAEANIISTLTGLNCTFGSPFVDTASLDTIRKDLKGKILIARVALTGGVNGEWAFVVPDKSVLSIANVLIGQEDNTELTDLIKNTFTEVITQMVSSMVSVISEKIGRQITPGIPNVEVLNDSSNLTLGGGQFFARLSNLFNLQDKGNLKFFSIIPVGMARNISNTYNAAKSAAATQYKGPAVQQTGVPVKNVAFEPLQMGVASEGMGNIALLLDVPMRVTVELGRTEMTIKEILGLGEGSIIELNKLAGEPVDILVNDKLIAQGEVVVIDENFAVRVTKIVTPMERIFEGSEGKI
ncbi:MAG: flagellar motor switch protein FliN [Brevinematales bacterium]|nr:flagellar motor switch protein FliN [Brevinematales bacterium]